MFKYIPKFSLSGLYQKTHPFTREPANDYTTYLASSHEGGILFSVPGMVSGEVTLPTANPEPDVKVSLHPAPQCIVKSA